MADCIYHDGYRHKHDYEAEGYFSSDSWPFNTGMTSIFYIYCPTMFASSARDFRDEIRDWAAAGMPNGFLAEPNIKYAWVVIEGCP